MGTLIMYLNCLKNYFLTKNIFKQSKLGHFLRWGQGLPRFSGAYKSKIYLYFDMKTLTKVLLYCPDWGGEGGGPPKSGHAHN